MFDPNKLPQAVQEARKAHERDLVMAAGLVELLSSGETAEQVAGNLAAGCDFDLRKALLTLNSFEVHLNSALRVLALMVALEIKEKGSKQ